MVAAEEVESIDDHEVFETFPLIGTLPYKVSHVESVSDGRLLVGSTKGALYVYEKTGTCKCGCALCFNSF